MYACARLCLWWWCPGRLPVSGRGTTEGGFVASFAELNAIRAGLEDRFPGWQIWYVPQMGGVTWCAQPWPVVNSLSPEQLAADITAAHESAASENHALAGRADYAHHAPGVTQADFAE